MNKKIIIAPLALGAVFALAATGVKDTVAVNAANDTTGWAMIGSAGTIEDTEGGISVKDAVYGSRAYKKAKVHLDGLSFTFSTTGLTDSVGDCRGFYFHNGATPWDFFTETKATVFSLWSIFTQNRFMILPNHDYNTTATASLSVSATDNSAAIGMSSAGGQLVLNFTSDVSMGVSFEKVEGADFYKATFTNSNIWGSPNYNATAGNNAFTYIPTANIPLDDDGNVYFCAYGLPSQGLPSVVSITNVTNTKGIYNVESVGITSVPTKLAYRYGEDLDLTGLVVEKVMDDGTKTQIPHEDLTITGYDKNTLGEQTVTVSYGTFSGEFAVTVSDYVASVELVSTPTKVTYRYGEDLVLAGAKIKVTTASGVEQEIDVTDSMISGYDKTTVGEQDVTVTFEGQTVTFKVTVEDYVTAVVLRQAPTKDEYTVGEALDVTGGEIGVQYASGKVETVAITAEMCSGFTSEEPGEVTVKVTYLGTEMEFAVTIKAAPVVDPGDEPGENPGENPGDEPGDEEPGNTEEKKGCKGSIIATSAIISGLALAGVALVAFKKKEEK